MRTSIIYGVANYSNYFLIYSMSADIYLTKKPKYLKIEIPFQGAGQAQQNYYM